MRRPLALAVVGGLGLGLSPAAFAQKQMPADQVIKKVIDADPWGLQGTEVSAKITIKDPKGSKRELAYTARSRRYSKDPQLAKSLLRFVAPADMAGMGFLQIQKANGEDDRWLYLPDLKRSRRIAGAARSQAFMGTDFSYGDLDQGEYRASTSKHLPEVKLGGFGCYVVEVKPTAKGAIYTKIEVWVRKDNYLPLKAILYGANGSPAKEFTVQEVQRVEKKWFITKSTMKNVATGSSSQLVLEKVVPRDDVPDDEFTQSTLEK